MSKKFRFAAAIFGLGCLIASAHAATPLTIEMDQSQLITVNAEPGSIVVGNPSIADASINGRQIFIHGHTFGQTNLMVFDSNGNKLLDFELTVARNTSNQLALFASTPDQGPLRYSYSCAPNCEANMVPGDNFDWTKNIILLSRAKYEFATGQKSADAKAPAAPQ
jgi:Pilus formation protein N terminal region